MNFDQDRWVKKLMLGASVVALASVGSVSYAQDVIEEVVEEDVIVVTGIRSSLQKSMELKRDATSIVDGITAEDMGKFPDSNLAESLQRVTGIAIDRSLGEGSSVTVRGWGGDFNLVTFNDRIMPTSTLGGGASAPSSRSFDFGNIASEAISAVEVYKTSQSGIATSGSGATINIRTTKPLESPGLNATIGVKGVLDKSQNFGNDITPEISGLYSNTFANDRLGVALSGSYQKRKGGVAQANVGWRDGYLGSDDFENEWGRLPRPGSWNYIDGVENPPGAEDVYSVPQNADYELAEFSRERINGQLTLQYDVTENIRATADYTYSENEIEVAQNTAGIWFDHAWTNSAWTDGPVAGPEYYTEFYGASDLSYSGSLTQNKSINKSLGFNVEWDVSDRFGLEFDFHDSTAESKPTNKYGSNMSLGTTVIGITEQSINFENDLPVISFTGGGNGLDPEDASVRQVSGSAFRNAYMKSDVQQLQVKGSYDVDRDIIESVDFGMSHHTNKIERAFGTLQTDSWGGLGSADDIPDDIFEWTSLPDRFDGISGADDPNMLQGFYRFDFAELADLAEDLYGICSSPWNGTPIDGTCLAEYSTNEFLEEKTLAAYFQVNTAFELLGRDANLRGGLRYENTDVVSKNSTPVYTGTTWAGGGNEFFITEGEGTNFFEAEGDYDYLLPSVYFDMQPLENVKLRAAFSKTIGRQTYDKLGGTNFSSLFRVTEGEANAGNPTLLPLEAKNYDASVEWYYGDDSYISVGAFHKDVENYTATGLLDARTLDGIYHPYIGPRADAARAVLGERATPQEVYDYIVANFPETLNAAGQVTGVAGDELVTFRTSGPVVSDETHWFRGLEFALQHMFGDSGFGVIANYTIADTDITFDDTQPYTTQQFALGGVGDSANLIGLYDKNGLQARVAWNWRDQYFQGGDRNPAYIESYAQLDANVSYEIRDGLTVFAEGIDITGSDTRGHRRHENAVNFYSAQEGRWALGARYNF